MAGGQVQYQLFHNCLMFKLSSLYKSWVFVCLFVLAYLIIVMKRLLLVRTKFFDVNRSVPLAPLPPLQCITCVFCFSLSLSKSRKDLPNSACNYVQARKFTMVLLVSQNWQQCKYSSVGRG